MGDPVIAVIDRAGTEPGEIEENLRAGAQAVTERVPARFEDATVTDPTVRTWVTELVASARSQDPFSPISRGRSLVLSGPKGTGKTHNAYGAVRALSVSGARCSWRVVNAADMFGWLQPNPHRNSEDELGVLTAVTLLVIDDLGAEKDSAWRQEVLYRLVNARYERILPTMITTNMTAEQFTTGLSDRVFSRVAGMSTWVPVTGPDRRVTGEGR